MAKRITSGKREREKLKQTKRQDKQKKKEERMRAGEVIVKGAFEE